MASQPIPELQQTEEEPRLSREEGWALLRSLYGSLRDAFPEEGGAAEVFRKEREAWGE
jgi:hypothetical protein